VDCDNRAGWWGTSQETDLKSARAEARSEPQPLENAPKFHPPGYTQERSGGGGGGSRVWIRKDPNVLTKDPTHSIHRPQLQRQLSRI